jgi:hypothetical protein
MSKSALSKEQQSGSIPGYDFGRASVSHSPLSIDELREIEMSTGWTNEDARVLEHYGNIFEERAEEMVDTWRAVIASQPHLAKSFFGPDGKPDEQYKAWSRAGSCNG